MATKRRKRLDRDVSAREFARAMLAAGQDHFEVLDRLRAMGRWREHSVVTSVGLAEGDLERPLRQPGRQARTEWDELRTGRRISALEYARELLAAGHDHFAVVRTLRAEAVWTNASVRTAVSRAEGEMGVPSRESWRCAAE